MFLLTDCIYCCCPAQVSDGEWEQLRDADFSAASSLQPLPLTERWIVSALHAVRTRLAHRCHAVDDGPKHSVMRRGFQ